MDKKWKLAGAALALAVVIPASAFASDGIGSKGTEKNEVILPVKETKHVVGKEDKLDLQAFAAKLGLDEAAFQQAIKDGKSFADIAKEKGIATQSLLDDLTRQLLAMFDDKQFTEEEMGDVQKKVAMEAQHIFDTPLSDQLISKELKAAMEKKKQANGIEIKLNFPALGAKLGLDDAAYEQAVKEGKSLADIAKEKGIPIQPLIDEQTEKMLASFENKQLTEEEMSNVKKKVAMESERIFKTPLSQQQKNMGLNLNVKVVITMLNLDKEALVEQMNAGKSFAEIAAAEGISRQQLIDAIRADLDAQSTKFVASKQLTQEQADKQKQELLKKIDKFIDNKIDVVLKK
ncbi:hypothetical protein SAMN05216378_1404 [Paenibacillus catalpae]|uniref:Uncharacterized protein n=1 Tax=Paenibacillus catalpae TaxID=1045775 RepID=A0A1I1V5M5_9BACL|nr:hypothetical protein [Paenibacillus catalpae]SFD78204.1 hypothetical protein SAMN05216378_1404 [Paenibacillus catalpae]